MSESKSMGEMLTLRDQVKQLQARNDLLERVYNCSLALRIRDGIDEINAAYFKKHGEYAALLPPNTGHELIISALDDALKNASRPETNK